MDDRKAQRREHILHAAERLFQHYGFAKTTVADIARSAEVGVGTVYLEFNSKAAIASELSLRRYDCMLSAMREVAASEGCFADRLQRMFTVKLEWLARFSDAGPHGQELIRGACMATNRAHAGFRSAQEDLLGAFLQAGVDAGEFDIAEPQAAARIVLRVLYAVTSLPEQSPGEASSKGILEQIQLDTEMAYKLLLSGLLKRNK